MRVSPGQAPTSYLVLLLVMLTAGSSGQSDSQTVTTLGMCLVVSLVVSGIIYPFEDYCLINVAGALLMVELRPPPS